MVTKENKPNALLLLHWEIPNKGMWAGNQVSSVRPAECEVFCWPLKWQKRLWRRLHGYINQIVQLSIVFYCATVSHQHEGQMGCVAWVLSTQNCLVLLAWKSSHMPSGQRRSAQAQIPENTSIVNKLGFYCWFLVMKFPNQKSVLEGWILVDWYGLYIYIL